MVASFKNLVDEPDRVHSVANQRGVADPVQDSVAAGHGYLLGCAVLFDGGHRLPAPGKPPWKQPWFFNRQFRVFKSVSYRRFGRDMTRRESFDDACDHAADGHIVSDRFHGMRQHCLAYS
jgi:hypothetical protein